VLAGLLDGGAVVAYLAFIFSLPGALLAAALAADVRSLGARVRSGLALLLGALIPIGTWIAFITFHYPLWAQQFPPHVAGLVRDAGGSHFWSYPLIQLKALAWDMRLTPAAVLLALLLPFTGRLQGMARIPAYFGGALFAFGLFSPTAGSLIALPFIYPVTLLILDVLLDAPPAWVTPTRVRWSLALVALNFVVGPACRLVASVLSWQQQSSTSVRSLIQHGIPAAEPIVGLPEIYYEAIAERHPFYQVSPLTSVRFPLTPKDTQDFQATLLRVKPKYFILFGDDDPRRLFGFLPRASFTKVDAYVTRPPSSFLFRVVTWSSLQARTYDLALWRLDSDSDGGSALR
jgi:hypothetical protein